MPTHDKRKAAALETTSGAGTGAGAGAGARAVPPRPEYKWRYPQWAGKGNVGVELMNEAAVAFVRGQLAGVQRGIEWHVDVMPVVVPVVAVENDPMNVRKYTINTNTDDFELGWDNHPAIGLMDCVNVHIPTEDICGPSDAFWASHYGQRLGGDHERVLFGFGVQGLITRAMDRAALSCGWSTPTDECQDLEYADTSEAITGSRVFLVQVLVYRGERGGVSPPVDTPASVVTPSSCKRARTVGPT